MTPKEKAQSLFKTFTIKDAGGFQQVSNQYIKICCLLAVNEIIELDALTDEGWLNVPQEYKVQYWKEVYKEIELL